MAITPEAAIQKIALVNHQLKALDRVQEELNAIIVRHAEELDLTEWAQPDGSRVKLSVKGYRGIDSRMAMNILGAQVAQKYGKIGVAEYDVLMAGDEITDEQKKRLKGLMVKNYSDPSVKVIPSMPMGDE
jgi:hypothetical protein